MMKIALKNIIEKEEGILNSLKNDSSIALLAEFIFKDGTRKEFWCKDLKKESNNGISYFPIAESSKPFYIDMECISSIWIKDTSKIELSDYLTYPLALSAYASEFKNKTK